MISEDLFSARKAMTRELFLIIAVIAVALILIVLIVKKGLLQDSIVTEDIAISNAKDISTYITSFSTVDGGLQTYSLPKKMNVEIKDNLVHLSVDGIKVSSQFSGISKETSFDAKDICIVKNVIDGEVIVCDSEDAQCCVPKIE